MDRQGNIGSGEKAASGLGLPLLPGRERLVRGLSFQSAHVYHQSVAGGRNASHRPNACPTLGIRLTMGTYTHIGLHDQSTAIEMLPSPPPLKPRDDNEAAPLRATGTKGPEPTAKMVPTIVPSGAENGAIRLAPNTYQAARDCTEEGPERSGRMKNAARPKALAGGTFRTASHEPASRCSMRKDGKEAIRPEGFEPPNPRFRRLVQVEIGANLPSDTNHLTTITCGDKRHPLASARSSKF